MPKGMHNLALPKVQLSEKVHHWTPDGSYGSRDFKFPTNVPMKLSSFDVGSLIASIFGKLKLLSQPKVEEKKTTTTTTANASKVSKHMSHGAQGSNSP